LRVADRLGIRDSLEETGSPSVGLGSEFKTWMRDEPIHGQVIATFPEPQGRTPIGPRLELEPSFGEPADMLLGRADFFRAFAITFREGPGEFELEW
jgi:hypothetical protein